MEEYLNSIDRQVSLKEVLEACIDCHNLGDAPRYMPWRFMKDLTIEECNKLDSLFGKM